MSNCSVVRLPVLVLLVVLSHCSLAVSGEDITRVDLLPPGPGNPRNSEGDMIALADGRLLLIYTHFTDGAGDHAAAHLASRLSTDGGKTWSSKDGIVVDNESGMNVMSVSLLRLQDGRIALFYLRKESTSDCRPVMRVSHDEGTTWSKAVEIIPDDAIGYYVLNNDRVVQLNDGRLIVPVAQHYGPDVPKYTPYAKLLCYYSDDVGQTWVRGELAPEPDPIDGKRVMLQEPGVVALADNRLLMWSRTDSGSQFVAYSDDRGQTWSQPKASSMPSPRSPATIERIPSTGDLLLVWNDHRDVEDEIAGKRTPLTVAVSKDEGKSWRRVLTLESNPHGWYCYTAMAFVDRRIVLAYCAGDRRENNGLALTRLTTIPLEMLD